MLKFKLHSQHWTGLISNKNNKTNTIKCLLCEEIKGNKIV